MGFSSGKVPSENAVHLLETELLYLIGQKCTFYLYLYISWRKTTKIEVLILGFSLASVKTRIQLDPVTYNRGLVGGFRQVIQNEGAGALLTGFGPTCAGYFLQGAFKFGGYELFKKQSINILVSIFSLLLNNTNP